MRNDKQDHLHAGQLTSRTIDNQDHSHAGQVYK